MPALSPTRPEHQQHPFVRALRHALVEDARADVLLALRVHALAGRGCTHGQIATLTGASSATVHVAVERLGCVGRSCSNLGRRALTVMKRCLLRARQEVDSPRAPQYGGRDGLWLDRRSPVPAAVPGCCSALEARCCFCLIAISRLRSCGPRAALLLIVQLSVRQEVGVVG